MRPFGSESRVVARASALADRWPAGAIVWLAGSLLTAIFGVFALVLNASQADIRQAAWESSTNIAAALSESIRREFDLLDMSLRELSDGAGRGDIFALPHDLRAAVLFDRTTSTRGLGALLLLDAGGRVVEQAGTLVAAPVDFADQPLFRAHRDRADVGLFISRPFVSLIDGEPSIAVSRRVERAGAFAGVAVGTVKVSYLQAMFARLHLGATGSLALVLDDGALVIERPFVQTNSVQALPYRWAMERLGTDEAGSFSAADTRTERPRQFFYNRVGKLPLVQIVSRETGEIYAAWWKRTILTGMAMLLLGNTILVLVLVLQAELKRRRAAEAALAVLATTDKLTGLANRRHFDERLEQAWAEAARGGAPLAMLLIDIDHFKMLNDALGHQAGDQALVAVGALLAPFAQVAGVVAARYGGEEFVLLLQGIDRNHAVLLGEEVRERVAVLAEANPWAPTGQMTVSVGVAAVVPHGTLAAADLLRASDAALYRAKRAGRDRVLAAERLAA